MSGKCLVCMYQALCYKLVLQRGVNKPLSCSWWGAHIDKLKKPVVLCSTLLEYVIDYFQVAPGTHRKERTKVFTREVTLAGG